MPDHVLVDRSAESPEKKRARPLAQAPDEGWKWIGWFGLLLGVIGLGDFVLAWYPLRFGSPEWEFGTVAAVFSGLPLVTMGFAGLLGSGVARGQAWLIRLMGWGLLAFGLLILAALVVFLTDVPVALKAVTGVAALGIKKAVVKTSLLGIGFSVGYVVAALAALRYLRKRNGAGHE